MGGECVSKEWRWMGGYILNLCRLVKVVVTFLGSKTERGKFVGNIPYFIFQERYRSRILFTNSYSC